jgi:DNA-binding LacI/PurR family transcriptional regulator
VRPGEAHPAAAGLGAQGDPYAAEDGFIVCGLEADRGEVAELVRRDIPFALIDSDRYENAPSVDADDHGGAREVAR